MPFLPPNQLRQSTEGKKCRKMQTLKISAFCRYLLAVMRFRLNANSHQVFQFPTVWNSIPGFFRIMRHTNILSYLQHNNIQLNSTDCPCFLLPQHSNTKEQLHRYSDNTSYLQTSDPITLNILFMKETHTHARTHTSI